METNTTKRKRGRPRSGVAFHNISVRIPLDLLDATAADLAKAGAGWQKAFEAGLDSLVPGWRSARRIDPRQLDLKIN